MKNCPTCGQQIIHQGKFCLYCGNVLAAQSQTQTQDKIMNCEWEFKCPLSWDNLQKSPNNDIRFCSSCQKNVYFAHSQNELDQLTEEGKCVAFHQIEKTPKPIQEPKPEDFPPPLMGMIAPPNDYLKPPPEPPIRPTMGMPVYTPPPEKKKWWEFWK